MELTPKQFGLLATKQDLRDFEKRMVSKEEFNTKFDRAMTVLDGMAQTLQKLEAEFASNQVAHDRFEKRIARIEKYLDLRPIRA